MIMSGIKHLSFLLLKLLLSLGLSVVPPFVAADEHQFSYSGFSNTNLTLDGVASVTPNGLLMLTNGTSRSMGRAFYPEPLRFRNLSDGAVQSFSASFVFAMVSIYKDLSSNGIAMFIAPSKNLSTAMRMQYLGLLSNQNDGNQTNHIFAVELDTFQNWELQDMNDNHVGIDINSLRSIQSHDAGFYHDKNGTFQSLSLDSQEVMQVWVDYHGDKMQIDATMAPIGMAKPTRPTVSASYNLSSVLTDVAYIGFSSAEGKITKHYVLGWSFGINSPAPAINLTMLPKLPLGPRTKGRRRLRVLEIILPLATAALILSLAAVVSLLVWRHFRYAEVRDDWEVEFGPHRFSYKDLFRATEGFDNKNLLGSGGFGRVYRGELSRSKLRIAVKRVSHDSRQGMKEFIAEIVSIGRLQNPNLAHLLGYCRRQGELLLVYEYMPKGSLDKYLYGEVERSTLSWDQRIWIIRGIASALIYLHEEWEKVVVHRDIKASNVLLDDELNARLGDFGLARLYDHGVEQETTRVVGTIGYIAPELARTGKGTPLTDVFAFGVFILEVTCGQRPIMQNTQDEQVMLVDWVLEHVQQGSLADAIDPRLKRQYNVSEAYLALKLGLLCSHPFACARPSMRQVIQYLDGHIEPPELPAHLSFQALALMQNEGFDSYVMSYPSSKSVGTISSISGGR
ncbi:L-type lectin-domain containing receptor kinase SIT2-like [Hordeum vulgare subsp. vulgare]|uniref:non-specific serine/threonine protein kinase n=1 Tax=Hordeum vulgare subsp. vulgare TaxID=112509 RepID=A0A8I6YW76_HORVV|nr:L-type lectin-domain containing receptor kinase SIT2-like [Hordeum vulgare subsp. vulgare]